MQFRLARWEFRVSLVPTVATFVVLPLLLALGIWQLGRAQIKAELLALRSQQSAQGPLEISQLGELGDEVRYRAVDGRGQYLAHRQVLLDNRTLDGRPGYHVLTPLVLESGVGVIVNRGWVALGDTRQQLPLIPVPEGSVVIHGVIDRPPRPGLRLGEGVVVKQGWPMVVLAVDLDDLSEILGIELLPMLVLLSPGEPGGFVRHWAPDEAFGPDRNVGYAAQWFALAAALLVIYLVVNLRRVDDGSR